MVAELTALRDQIDEVDKALLNLLAKRLELVAEVLIITMTFYYSRRRTIHSVIKRIAKARESQINRAFFSPTTITIFHVMSLNLDFILSYASGCNGVLFKVYVIGIISSPHVDTQSELYVLQIILFLVHSKPVVFL